jgi:hypothetical protein
MVEFGCPWCEAPVAVAPERLDQPLACGECGVSFELAGDVPAEMPLAA